MRSARTTIYILIFASLLATGALALTGCGRDDSNATGSFRLSDCEAFVVSVVDETLTDGTTAQVGDVTQVREATVSYKIDATDPRVAGTFDVVYNYDQAADGSGKMWGTWTVTNDNGTWVCDAWRGAFDDLTVEGRFFTAGLGQGTGAYEGLASWWQWSWSLNPSPDSALPPVAVSGWIQKAP